MADSMQLPLRPLPPGRLPVFVDTGFLVALFNRRDDYASTASEFYEQYVLHLALDLWTSSSVAAETLEHLSREIHAVGGDDDMLERCADFIFSSGEVTLVNAACEEVERAKHLLQKHRTARIGWIDCLTLALMDQHEIRVVCTFDAHFMRHTYMKGREERSLLVLPAHKSLLRRE